MLNKLKALREEREEGFTLIELLVVILIIGILASIAIPVFLNQRQTANDGVVKSDLRNAALAVETALVTDTPSTYILTKTTITGKDYVCFLAAAGACTLTTPGVQEIKISNGVTLVVGTTKSPNGYELNGYHANGKQYTSAAPLKYNSATGGLP